jgi:transposase InsO family protein
MMEEKIEVGKKTRRKNGAKKWTKVVHRYELRLRAVKLHLEEGIRREVIGRELGASESSVSNWINAYRREGEEGLRNKPAGARPGQKKLPEPVTARILELKKAEPSWGVKRIAQVLRRMFWLPGSPETVRTRLHEAGLMNQERAKGRRNLTRPRFFERATPNQMWQTDIFTFRLGGKYAYLIAFLDDYSRYVVGVDLFRSPTGAAVIEVYRIAMGEYQPPKEMLTDNGRQYTTWRGTSRFEAELQKDRVIHIKSRPQHPMTLGKVERFWSTIWQEFLARAPFDSFEAARERIRLWIAYYNHKRPHQGIGGVCPADRYFEVAGELRKTMASGVADNVLEMALRGMPRAPFYMVGRMEGQSVVLRAEKGKLKLSVDGENEQELVYDLKKGDNDGKEGQKGNDGNDQKDEEAPAGQPEPQPERGGQGAGGAGGVDGTGEAGASVPAVGREPDHVLAMAGTGDGGDAAGAGKPGEPGGGAMPESAVADALGQAASRGGSEQTRSETGEAGRRAGEAGGGPRLNEVDPGTVTSRLDHAGAEGGDHGDGGGPVVGRIAQNLLSVGEAWPVGPALGSERAGTGASVEPGRPGKGSAPKKSGGAGGGVEPGQGSGGGTAGPARHGQNPGTQGAQGTE